MKGKSSFLNTHTVTMFWFLWFLFFGFGFFLFSSHSPAPDHGYHHRWQQSHHQRHLLFLLLLLLLLFILLLLCLLPLLLPSPSFLFWGNVLYLVLHLSNSGVSASEVTYICIKYILSRWIPSKVKDRYLPLCSFLP